MSEKCYTPIAPLPKYYESNPRAHLSAEEQGMYDQVLAHFAADEYALPAIEKGELMDEEKFWLSRECLLRFLRASKWKTETAIQRLENTLKWRREYGLYDKLTAEHVEPEALTGKEILYGFDTKGKPGFYMIPSRQNTEESPRQVEFAVFMLERCIDLMQPGVETLAILINFAQRAKNPSLGIARQVLNILQDHYPERLGHALIINIPFLINAFFKIILPFVDPITREKLKFNVDVVKEGIFEKDMCMSEFWGGSRDFEYDHDKYWKALVTDADNNCQPVGISEWEYKGGPSPALEDSAGIEDLGDKHKEDVSVIAVPALTINPAADAPLIPEVVIQPATAVPDVTKVEGKAEKGDTAPTTTTSHGEGQSGSHATTAGGAATSGGDGGAAGADGGAAE
ncbi:CRAL-TRIO domain-containing protein [Ephemerocybe angulata]|uniref:CRAL-TRIO domain-containing protein n=1 Tax=Ephemerocybe angulata TaxID=980116 RepID=A0A8H6IHS6_9AGAR|nr:CRAL-TRIO domain-containing protein [Tulosesus angulatus]